MVEDANPSDLAERLEKTLQQSELENNQLVQTISALLRRSVEYGRAGRVLGNSPTEEKCQEYIDKVVAFYQKYHVVVTCLERRDQEAWINAVKKIHMWANGYLKKRDIHGPLRKKSLEECGQNAALAFLTSCLSL